MLNFPLNRWLKTFAAALLLTAIILFVTPAISPSSDNGTTNAVSVSDVVYAENGEGDTGPGLTIPSAKDISPSISKKSFAETLVTMVNYFIGFLGFLATLAFVYAGVLWILSGGSEELITKSKKIMTYAALGILVVILSYSAVTFITRSVPQEAGTGRECITDADCEPDEFCFPPGGPGECMSTVVTPECLISADCPPGEICRNKQCVIGDEDVVIGEDTTPAVDENLEDIDDLIDGLGNDLSTDGLSEDAKEEVEDALNNNSDNIEQKIDKVEDMLKDENLDSRDAIILERILNGLTRLQLLKDELEDLYDPMPKSEAIIENYNKTVDALDRLIKNPVGRDGSINFGRFESSYKKLKELIRRFPVVKSRIRAQPGEGNVPFTVQFDGLDSIDPTGGTISKYEWKYLDSNGQEVFIGDDPVVVHEFTEPNTYAVRLRVSTSQMEGEYETATAGVSVVRIRANPPASQVRFRINGADAFDIFHVTVEEAQAGLAFDPSPTVPALGRTIEKYEWFYGDGMEEVRTTPTTVVHTYTSPGEYFVKLITTDNLGVKDKAIIKLFVKSLAADIRITPSTGNVNTEFNFVGIGSRSDDGIIKNFEWEIQDIKGNIIHQGDKSSFYYRFDRPGTYKIILLITDITGAKDKVVKELEVTSRPPFANFTFSIPRQNHPNKVEFNAADSYDPDEGDSITYSWDFDGDGNFDITDGSDAVVTHEYEKTGEYRAKLQVTDAFGKHDLIEKKVPVKSVLSADIVAESRATRVGEPIDFSVQSPNAVAYLWEFGDGETESTDETTVSHTYGKVGKFTVRLNFFDEEDNDNFATKRILVGAGDQPLAVIDYLVSGREARVVEDLCGEGKEGLVVTRADLIRFDARSSINTDGSSRLLSYDWTFPGGEKSSDRDSSFKFDEINREGECFSVTLVVRDQLSGKLSKKDEMFFKVINQLPKIIDFIITPPEADEFVTPVKVKLKVINPKDLDGTIKKYRWWYYREGFEDEKLGIHSTAVPETDITITSFGEMDVTNRYFFVVEINDNDNGVYNSVERFGEVSYLDIKNGPNLSPVAEFTMDKTTISVGDSITFVSSSYDPQGEILPNDAFRWDFDGDGEFDDTTSGPQVNRQFNTPGEYNVRLKVVYRGLSSSVGKTVFVEATDTLPQAAFTYSVDGNTVTFDGGHSRFDPSLEDTTLRFEWDFDVNDDENGNGVKDDDVQATEIQPTFEYPETGIYKVKLKVKDMLGMEGVVVREVDLALTEAERQKNAYRSLKVSAPKHPLTTLYMEVIPAVLEKGGSADIEVRVLNADGSPYNGKVFFEITEGSGHFTPNPVEARDSKASSVFNSVDEGEVRIRIRATDTLYGELTESAVINVK